MHALIRKTLLFLLFSLVLVVQSAGALSAIPAELDPEFGQGGIVFTKFEIGGYAFIEFSDMSYGTAVAVVDGRYLEAGFAPIFHAETEQTNHDFVVARFTPDGLLDPTFGNNGVVTTDFGGEDIANALAVQSDGRFIVVGYTIDAVSGGSDIVLARYSPDGSLDISFGNDGKIITDVNGGSDSANSVALQPGGEIIVTGSAQEGLTDNEDFDIAIQHDDKIVVAGESYDENYFSRFTVARYDNFHPFRTFLPLLGR